MSQGYTAHFGRVSRPPKALAADRPAAPEWLYQPYVPRRMRNRADRSLPGAGGLNPGASGMGLQMPSSLLVVQSDDDGSERPVTPLWSKGYWPPQEDTDSSGSPGKGVLPVDDKTADEAAQARESSSGTLLSQPEGEKSMPSRYPTVAKPVRRQQATGGAAIVSGAGSSAQESTGSLRSPSWLQEAAGWLKKDKSEVLQSWAAQATKHVALAKLGSRIQSHDEPEHSIKLADETRKESLFKIYGTHEYGSRTYRYPSDEIPPAPKVLEPDTPEDAGKMVLRKKGNREAQDVRGLEAERPMARQAPSTRQTKAVPWNSSKNATKPLNSWLADGSIAMTQPTAEKASAYRMRVAPSRPGSQTGEAAVDMSKRSEHELEEQLEEQKRKYQELLAEKRELELRLALHESTIEVKRSLKKRQQSEAASREFQEDADAPERAEPSASVGMVEQNRPVKESSSYMRARNHPEERSSAGIEPKTMNFVSKATVDALAHTKMRSKEVEEKAALSRRLQSTSSILKSSRSSGNRYPRGLLRDQATTDEETRPHLPSSNCSSLPPSNDEDGSKEQQRRLRKDKKERRKAIKAVYSNKPRAYNGEAVYDKYESWMEDFRDWRDLHDLREYGTMIAMSLVITSDAKEWYNLNVRGHEKEWTLKKVSEEMFLDLFPEDYATTLRESFESACQGENSLKKWHRYLMKLSTRVKFVNEHEIRRRFWSGSAMYLQKEWAMFGLNPERADTKVEAMLEAGLRFERARGYGMAEEKRRMRESASRYRQTNYLEEDEYLTNEDAPTEEEYSIDEEGEYSEEVYPTEDEDCPDDEGESSVDEGEYSVEEGESPTEEKGDPTEEEYSTEEEGEPQEAYSTDHGSDQLQSRRRCFRCRMQGHIARNCPQRRRSRPREDETISAYNGSLQFEGVPSRRRTPIIHLGLMEVFGEDEDGVLTSGSDESTPERNIETSGLEGASNPASRAIRGMADSGVYRGLSELMEKEWYATKVEHPEPQRNPKGNRQTAHTRHSSRESDDSPEKVMEPKWERGRPRKTVSPAATQPIEEPTSRESSAAPLMSEESDIPSLAHQLASQEESTYDSGAEGESEVVEPSAVKTSHYESIDEPRETLAIENSKRVPTGRSYTRNLEARWESEGDDHSVGEKTGGDVPDDPQKTTQGSSLEISTELNECQLTRRELKGGTYREDVLIAKVLADQMRYVLVEVEQYQGSDGMYLKERVLCLPEVRVGSKREVEVIATYANTIWASPELEERSLDETRNFVGVMDVEEVLPVGDRGDEDDEKELSAEIPTQKVTQSNSRISYSIYITQPNSNAPQTSERDDKNHQDNPTAPKPVLTISESRRIAAEIGSAEKTLNVAAGTPKVIDKISLAVRRAIHHHVEKNPSKYIAVIELSNAINQNVESAEHNAKGNTTKQPPSAPTQSTMQPLVTLTFEPMNHANNPNETPRGLVGHQAAPSNSAFTSNGPRRSKPASQDLEDTQLPKKIGTATKKDPDRAESDAY